MVHLVRKVLQFGYNRVMIYYGRFSRDKEFQADRIAAMTVGRNVVTSALKRTSLGEMTFGNVINGLHILTQENKVSENIYEDHRYETKRMAETFHFKMEEGLPVVEKNDKLHFIKNRVVVKDLYDSHPTTHERTRHLTALTTIPDKEDKSSCWSLLNNAGQLQQEMTRRFYAAQFIAYDENTVAEHQEYQKITESDRENYQHDKIYKGFYSDRKLLSIDVKKQDGNIEPFDPTAEFSGVYNVENTLKFRTYDVYNEDLLNLYKILQGEITARLFEFDGEKYRRKDAAEIGNRLSKDIEALEAELQQLEEKAFRFNFAIAGRISEEARKTWIAGWKDLEAFQEKAETLNDHLDDLSETFLQLNPNRALPYSEVRDINRSIARSAEKIKPLIKEL